MGVGEVVLGGVCKGDEKGFHVSAGGFVAHEREDVLVSSVHAVEVADGSDGWFRNLLVVANYLHTSAKVRIS